MTEIEQDYFRMYRQTRSVVALLTTASAQDYGLNELQEFELCRVCWA